MNGFDVTMELFDEAIGLGRLMVIHLNDSKGGLNSKLDCHEHIGMEFIGDEGFRAVIGHPAVRRLPAILETPVDSRRGDRDNLCHIRMIDAMQLFQVKENNVFKTKSKLSVDIGLTRYVLAPRS